MIPRKVCAVLAATYFGGVALLALMLVEWDDQSLLEALLWPSTFLLVIPVGSVALATCVERMLEWAYDDR